MANPVELIVGARAITDFEVVQVSTSIEKMAWDFTLTTAPAVARSIRLGDTFELYAEPRTDREHLLLRGWLEEVESSVGPERTGVVFKGRSRSGILVDCSSIHDPGEWLGVSLIKIANELSEPYGVSVFLDSEDQARNGPFPPLEKFALEEGETVFETLDRLARRAGALLFPRPGGIVITRPGSEVLNATAGENGASLVEGQNVKSSRVQTSLAGRFAEYLVRGQSRSSDNRNGASALENSGLATDPSVVLYNRYGVGSGPTRRRLIIADGSLEPGEAQTRANFEAAVAAARASSVSIGVQGWAAVPEDPYSSLWLPNYVVPVDLPSQGIREDLLISGVDFQADNRGGSTAQITLRRPDSFLPSPEVASAPDFEELDFGEVEDFPTSFLD